MSSIKFDRLVFTPPGTRPANQLTSPDADSGKGKPVPGRLEADIPLLVFDDQEALAEVAYRIEETKNRVREGVGKSVAQVAEAVVTDKNTLNRLDYDCPCATEKHHRRVAIKGRLDASRSDVDALVQEAQAEVEAAESALVEVVFNSVVDVLVAREVRALIGRAVTGPHVVIV